MDQLEYLLIGGLIALGSAITVQFVSHTFSLKRDKYQREEDQKKELTKEVKELEAKKAHLEGRNTELKITMREMGTGKIILMNQRRDLVLGFSQDEMNGRAIAMRTILSGLDLEEIMDIADERKPIPIIPGKPHEEDL